MRATRRIYGRHPDGYRVLLAVPGDEVSQATLDREDPQPEKPKRKPRKKASE